MPIHRSKFYGNHPHVIVLQGKKQNVSLGLTSNNTRGDLIPVKYSNGKFGFMQRNVTVKNKTQYDSKKENFHLDIESENYAYKKAISWMLKQIGKK